MTIVVFYYSTLSSHYVASSSMNISWMTSTRSVSATVKRQDCWLALMVALQYLMCFIDKRTRGAPNADISLQSGRFWATVIASSRERLLDLRSCWIVFIHVVQGRPGGRLQFSEGEAVMILLASVIGRGRRSWVHLSWWLPSTQIHTGR